MPPTEKLAPDDNPMPSSFDKDLEFWDEGRWAKLGRKLREEPLIPIGLAATCYALYNATKSIRKGDKLQTNKYFRWRVYAQGFTLLCLCAGSVYYKKEREERKYYRGLLGEQKAQEKRDAWIRELEARDREDQEERERKVRRREARRAAERGEGPLAGAEGKLAETQEKTGEGLLSRGTWLWKSKEAEEEENRKLENDECDP